MKRAGRRVTMSFRLDAELVTRLHKASKMKRWPPPPSMTEIVERGVKRILVKLENGTKITRAAKR
jgi:hypothetical protein